ncbi:CaiB/BaiF CoA-transferase family protein [Hydrogenophaga sp.]|uniref:CaiB/BaiF CoA transferase family protein n=1 Tax=Hydrogenophaga sp. TaxID=1904254 RepID=UPI002727EF24|nr:CoA transferase [Hydrogenophaga sp.]MDO9439058.1 CoA transferase [Hydrogenophaga sp.]
MNPFDATRKDLPRPLEGVRIIECGVWHAGPGGTAILGDLGAEVIKIESLDGDPERHNPGRLGTVKLTGVAKDDWSVIYEISNRNKRGICVDIATEEGREILSRLVATADIFMTNFRAPTIPKLGVDEATIRAINPKIIHITVSGYGSTGPLADLGGFDPMGQAVSGMAFITGSDEPVVLQVLFLDQMTAIVASHAMITALFVRERHGYGQALHVSLYGSATWIMYANLLTTSIMKQNLATKWDRQITPPLRNCYRCSDGQWIMGTCHPEGKYWRRFCELIGLPDHADDPRYESSEKRAENVRSLIAAIDAAMLAKTREQWLKIFHANGVLFVGVQSMTDVLQDPQAHLNGYVKNVDHPTLGQVTLPGYPVQFSANSTRLSPAPDRGQHTREVLREIGYTESQIDAMCAATVIKA